MKKAIVYFADGSKSLCRVNASYSQGGVHYYDLARNALNTWLDWEAGETKLYTDSEVESLRYQMN